MYGAVRVRNTRERKLHDPLIYNCGHGNDKRHAVLTHRSDAGPYSNRSVRRLAGLAFENGAKEIFTTYLSTFKDQFEAAKIWIMTVRLTKGRPRRKWTPDG